MVILLVILFLNYLGEATPKGYILETLAPNDHKEGKSNDYKKDNVWEEDYVWAENQQIFVDVQCPNIGNNPGLDISACKKKCHVTPNCSAINVRIDGASFDCVLRACHLPVPYPYWQMSGYKSYYKYVWPIDTVATIATTTTTPIRTESGQELVGMCLTGSGDSFLEYFPVPAASKEECYRKCKKSFTGTCLYLESPS